MDINDGAVSDELESSKKRQKSNGIKVRDMVRRYNTAVSSDSTKTSYSSIISTKSSYFGVNANAHLMDESSSAMFDDAIHRSRVQTRSPSTDSSRNTIRKLTPPKFEMQTDHQAAPLDKQKSFINLSRSREPPKAAPREKKARHLAPEENTNAPVASYQSKTTISKTPSGVRIIIDMFFDQDKQLSIQEVVGSRVETDIPPSKILNEFQKRVAEYSRN